MVYKYCSVHRGDIAWKKLTVFIEDLLENKKWALTFTVVAMVGPLYFFKTVYAVWFGPEEVLYGFKSEWSTFVMLTIVNIVALLTTLPAREKNRPMQIVMSLWVIAMFLVALATFVR